MLPINLFSGPPAHGTKWTVVVDRPRAARTLTLFDSQAEANAEIIRLRERGVAHVFALPPVAPPRVEADNWQRSAWMPRPPGIGNLPAAPGGDHFAD